MDRCEQRAGTGGSKILELVENCPKTVPNKDVNRSKLVFIVYL